MGYLKAVAGSRTVPVEVGSHYLAAGWGQALMPFSEFLDRHLTAPAAGVAQHSAACHKLCIDLGRLHEGRLAEAMC